MKNTRYEQVAEKILGLINNGVWKSGEKIPSIRQLSSELGVSVNTIKEAYWLLESRNHIVAVPQSGFYVARQAVESADKCALDPRLLDPQKVSLCHIYGAFLDVGRATPESSLGIAALNPELWPKEKMGRFFQDAVRYNENDAYNYLMTPGYGPLREQIARIGLAGGLELSPDELIVTNGCQEAIFLALMAVCKPGDSVALESPMYFNLLQLLQLLDLRVIEMPCSSGEGIGFETLRFVMENPPVKAMFTTSNFNNPLGFSMAPSKKKRLVELLTQAGITLIEDDIYGDLGFKSRPETCKSFDRDGRVILCSSFSKTLAPGLRVGWIAPGPRYYDQVMNIKTLLNLSTGSINQIAVARFLKEGGYERHLRKLRKTLQEQVFAVRAAVLKYFPKGTQVTNPRGGFLLWVELPEEIDTNVIYRQALLENIIVAPGRLFTLNGGFSNCLRLNAGYWNERVEQCLRRLGRLCLDLQQASPIRGLRVSPLVSPEIIRKSA
jgi:DNA-binding transcriptional MocR family regulator